MKKNATCRAFTKDVAFAFRMGSGFPGDVNRAHPMNIEPALINVANPPAAYGNAVLLDTATNSVRNVASGDTGVTRIYGMAVRPYPTQQAAASNFGAAAIGAAAPPAAGVMDVLRDGYGIVRVFGSPTKDGAVFVWVAASSGGHIQGALEAAATGGSTAAIANARFNGPPDANGFTEVIFNRT